MKKRYKAVKKMIRTKDHTLRKAIFFAIKTIAIILVACFAIEYPLPLIGEVAAADKVYYISEIKAFQAETEEEAKRLCESEGYVCAQKNLNAGTGRDAVFIGYKFTENRSEALYDISLLQMNGGYQIKDYAQANAELEKSNSGAAETMFASANEFIVNYENDSPKAKEAYEGLNLFNIPEAGNMKLGDYILQGKATKEFFAKVMTHASTGAVNAITNFLSTGLTPMEKETDEETGQEVDVTWAGNVKKSSLWGIIEDEDISEDELADYDKEMGDDAQALFKQLQIFAAHLENGQAVYNEEKYLSELKNTNMEEAVNSADKPSDEDKSMAYVNAYSFLNQHEAFDGMPLGEYLVNIGKQTSEEVDFRKLYPVIDSMSYAQRKMIGMAGLMSLISTLGENEESKQAKSIINQSKEKIKELMNTDSFSIWINTNPEMADKKVAFTSDAIRVHAAQQMLNDQTHNTWEDAKDTINEVLKWINVGSSAITVLTFLTGEYGIAGLALLAAKSAAAVVASTTVSIATKVIAISTMVSSWAGLFSLIILAITIWFYVITLIIDYVRKTRAQEYTEMADYAIDVRNINGRYVNVTYKAVKDNKNRIADLNAYKAQNGWVCLYTSKDPNSGSPIRADESGNVFNIVYGEANKLNGYDCASFFGQITPGNCNTGAKKDNVNGIYINYYTERSLSNRSQSSDPDSGSKGDDGAKRYYSDLVVMSGKTPEIAKSKITVKEGGYQIFDQNLSPDARKVWENQDQYIYIGYKTTTDPKQAIRDIRVATFTSTPLTFGDISYACAGTLGFPANGKDENQEYPSNLDGLYFTSNENAGTPIEVGKLHLVSSHDEAQPGWEPVTTFSGLPYNFATTRYNGTGVGKIKPGRYHVYAYEYNGYATGKDHTWANQKRYLYYEPQVKYTEGTKYLSGIFFGFGTDSESTSAVVGETEASISELFDTLSATPHVEEASASKGVNLAQSYYYKGFIVDSHQKYLRLYYTWSYNPYRALTDVQAFRGEPYISNLPYTIEKALTYPPKAAASAQTKVSYASASVAVQRSTVHTYAIRGISPENAYMAPNGLLGMNDQVCEGFTREAQGNFTFAHEMPLLPTGLYVAGYVNGLPRLTLDDIVISQNKHDGVNNNGTLTCDVSNETTLGGNKAEGDFFSIQDLKDPHCLTAFNISYPSWTDDEGSEKKDNAQNGDKFHAAGTSIYMYIKHQVVKKRYISRIFVGACTRDDAKSTDKDVLKNFDKQVDLKAMVEATSAGSDEMIPFDVAGDPTKAWYNYVQGGDDPEPPKNGDPAAYVSVARTDDPDKAVKSIVLYKSEAKAVPEQMQVDGAVYYCASNTTPIRMSNNKNYYLYYSYNQGTVPGKPITELNINEDVFVSGYSTALVVDNPDTTQIKNGKINTTNHSKPYGYASLQIFIHAAYEVRSVYFNKIFAASGNTAKEAQLGLLEQGCTEFCNIDLNKGAGGKYIYFGYRGFTLREDKINSLTTDEARENEKEKQLQEAIYDIVCTVGEEFHPEGILSDRYQIYYSPVAKPDKSGNFVGTNLNEGTTGPEIYMYFTTTYAAKNYNENVKRDSKKKFSTMPKDYLLSPLTKIGFALYDYVPYSQELAAASSGSEEITPWEYVMNSNNKSQIDLNEGAVSFDKNHLTGDNRITMFAQREAGNVKPSAEITGGYNTALVTETKLFLQK